MRGGVWSALVNATAATRPAEAAKTPPAREKFLPITRHALLDRLTHPQSWPAGEAKDARRLMRYLDYWRRHAYAASLLELEQLYEPFSPDSDLLTTRVFSAQEKLTMQKQVVEQMHHFLVQANFEHEVDPADVKIILTKERLTMVLTCRVDLGAFEEILIFYRGATTMTEGRRTAKRLFLCARGGEDPRVSAAVLAVQFALGIDRAVNEAFLPQAGRAGPGSVRAGRIGRPARRGDGGDPPPDRHAAARPTSPSSRRGSRSSPTRWSPSGCPTCSPPRRCSSSAATGATPWAGCPCARWSLGGGAWSEAVAVRLRENPAIASAWARGQVRKLEDRYVAGTEARPRRLERGSSRSRSGSASSAASRRTSPSTARR